MVKKCLNESCKFKDVCLTYIRTPKNNLQECFDLCDIEINALKDCKDYVFYNKNKHETEAK